LEESMMEGLKMECKRCGRCCNNTWLALADVPGNDPLEIGKWLALHRCDVQIQDRKGKKVVCVRIPYICSWLTYDKEGEAVCKDYENRPAICKNYFCDRCKE